MMKKQVFLPVLLIIGFLIFGCSKEDDTPTPEPDPVQEESEPDPEPDPQVLIGVFKDAEVEGLTFETTSQNGTTNAAGEFTYLEGEEVTFKVGDLILGSALGQELITPITLAQSEDSSSTIESNFAQNIAALLQTLDADGDSSNGIAITTDVANSLGIENIDFNQPIEAILADIVLNVIQNTGVELSIVYPNQAANAMANSLGIVYEAPVNLSLENLMPTLKVYLESWEQNYTPPSAVYKNTFNELGNLTSVEVLSRYSGKQFYQFNFDMHAPEGLPISGDITNYISNGLYGASPNFSEVNNKIQLSYNANNQLEKLDYLLDGEPIRTELFTSYDESNRPLSYFRNIGADDPNVDFTITWTFTFDSEGLIATANRNFSNFQTIDANNSFETITTRNFTHTHNVNHNLTSVTYDRVFEDNIVTNGELKSFISTAMVMESFSYDGSQKLTAFDVSEEILPSGGDLLNVVINRKYDSDELIETETYSNTNGFESETSFNQGVRSTFTSTQDGLPSRQEEYFADGSQTSTIFYYFDAQLSQKEIIEYNADFFIKKITREFYAQGAISFFEVEEYTSGVISIRTGFNADGSISYIDFFDEFGRIISTEFYSEGIVSSIQEFEYNTDGFINKVTFKDADGNVVQVNNYTLNASGQILMVEVLLGDGSLWLTETWEYDENGLVSKITVDYADGFQDIYYYEDGILVRGEFYDDNGELYDTVDYSGTGKLPLLGSIKDSQNKSEFLSQRFASDKDFAIKLNKMSGFEGKNSKLGLHIKRGQERNRILTRHLKNIERLHLNKH